MSDKLYKSADTIKEHVETMLSIVAEECANKNDRIFKMSQHIIQLQEEVKQYRSWYENIKEENTTLHRKCEEMVSVLNSKHGAGRVPEEKPENDPDEMLVAVIIMPEDPRSPYGA